MSTGGRRRERGTRRRRTDDSGQAEHGCRGALGKGHGTSSREPDLGTGRRGGGHPSGTDHYNSVPSLLGGWIRTISWASGSLTRVPEPWSGTWVATRLSASRWSTSA